MQKYLLVFAVLLLLGTGMAFGQGWVVYTCDSLPAAAAPAWIENDKGPTTGVADYFTVIPDPSVSGNRLLQCNKPLGFKESYNSAAFTATNATGITAVFRLKRSQMFADTVRADTSWLFDRWIGFIKPRIAGAKQEEVRIQRTALSRQYEIRMTSSLAVVPISSFCPTDSTLLNWHIYRVTIKNDTVKVYFDEKPTVVLTGVPASAATATNVNIGGNATNAPMNGLYDWIIWDSTAAYAPGQGAPIPSGLLGTVGVGKSENLIPTSSALDQNYPNPFNPTTTISYKLSIRSQVALKIFDVLGQEVAALVNEVKSPGVYSVVWNANRMPSGVYFYQLKAGNYSETKKLVLMK